MAFMAFTQTHIYERRAAPKEKDKSGIQCLECYERNLYIGTKDATVQHLIFSCDQNPAVREGRARKLGSGGQVSQLRVLPLFNQLLVLWDRSLVALNMFSLEPLAALKKIQHVSLFEVCSSSSSSSSSTSSVQMVTSSSRRRAIQVHVVGVDRWEVVREVPLALEPVALAVDGTSLCLATAGRYLLCDFQSGVSEELFPHDHSKQHIVVTSVGQGEFLLNGPGSLGMFVMKTGICQRPPLQWPREVLAAAVCFPYVLTLQAQGLCAFSVLDQQHKQTLSLGGAKGLLATSDGAYQFTERDVFRLRMVPIQEQIQALVRQQREEEALLLLDGVHARCPLDSYMELQKDVSCLAGFVHFHQRAFSEARDLFIRGELDPREIILLYPKIRACLGAHFRSRLDQESKAGEALWALWREDAGTRRSYLRFLGDFLGSVRETPQALGCSEEVDCALLRLHAELGDAESLRQLVASPNACALQHCVPVLEQHSRFFALGLLLQSHGNQVEAIQTWVKIADGVHQDTTCSDVYGHIVQTLSQLDDKDIVWKFAGWTLQKSQETGVRIFCRRRPHVETRDVEALLEDYPQALLRYLEFLVHHLNSEEERHHSRLALAYVAQAQRAEEEADGEESRRRLQQHLWESRFYSVSTVFESVRSTSLHTARAVLLLRAGEHREALRLLVEEVRDPQAVEAFCCRAAQGQDAHLRPSLLLSLLQIYLGSEEHLCAAVDLLNNNPQVLSAEQVVRRLPDSWSVQLVSQFLVGSLRERLHQRRMASLQTALSLAELTRHKVIRMQACRTKFRLDPGQKCKACDRDLAQPQFARSLGGELMHTSCLGSPSSPSSSSLP